MTDELKIFGKVFHQLVVASDGGTPYTADHGIFRFMLIRNGDESYGLLRLRNLSPESLYHTPRMSEAEAIAELESEARRIMRECLEIAGPMFAEEPCGIGLDSDFVKRVPVRF